jgi:ppGpp synthetase/RelA/SpoT-type nucleotidyltranferase
MNENVRNMKINIEEAANSMKRVVDRIQSVEDLITKLNLRSTNLNQDY